MASRLREFLVGLGIDADERRWKRADQMVEKLGQSLRKGLALAFKVAGAAALGAAALVAKWTASTLTAADAAQKTARAVGLSTEAWQELRHAAELSGIQDNELSVGLQKVQRQAHEAKNGNKELAKTFRSLNINVAEFSKLSPDKMLEQLADSFDRMPEGPERTAAVMKLLEEQGPKFFNLFEGGSKRMRELREEAQELGIVLSTEDAKAMEGFNDDLTRMRRGFDGIKQQLVVGFLPVLQSVVNRILDWQKANRKLIKDRLDRAIKKIEDASDSLKKKWEELDKFVNDKLGGWGEVFRGVASALAGAGAVSGLMKLHGALKLVIPFLGAFSVAGAVAAAKIILIVGAIALVGLAIEDFITYLQGGESYTGDFIDAWADSDTIFGKIANRVEAVGELIGSVTEFIGTAAPIAWEAFRTIAGPAIDLVFDAVKALGDYLFGEWSSSMEEGTGEIKDMADWFDRATKSIKDAEGKIKAFSASARAKVQAVTDVVRKLAGWIGKLPLGKIAEMAGSITDTARGTIASVGMAGASPGAVMTNMGSRAGNALTQFMFGDTNVQTDVRNTGATAQEIAKANADAVTGAQAERLQLAYARLEGREL